MAKDLHSFLKDLQVHHPDLMVHIDKPVNPADFDATAILELLNKRGQRPLAVFEHPMNLYGEDAGIPLVMNVFATRERCAVALGLDPDDAGLPLSLGYSKLGHDARPPVVVSASEAPVKEIIKRGDDIDTRFLPIVTHSEGDYGPCLTMTLAVKDPVSGSYNASFIKAFYDFEDPQRLRVTIHSPDSLRALAYYEEHNLPMPIVAILGHHPAFYLGTMGLTPYESDDYETIGGFLGEPLRLVPSETWGEDFMVPADAEILIEGEVPPGVRMIADPFGDITRQYQAQTLRPVMNITAITQRRDAYMQDIFAGHHDHFTAGQIPKEGTIYNSLRRRFGDLIHAVHLPYSGCGRLLCYISINKRSEGQAKSVALAALLESWTFSAVVVVDHVIDVFNESDVIWATLVNVDPSRDVDMVHNIPKIFTTEMHSDKVVIDATRPMDRAIPDMNRVPADAMARISLADYLREA
ncbi:MAG TPA: UbiD family decarboxylase [Mycobacteriales bacterium]|nr:UbiD family decarboxylase [Mycobacteriales bacterium]